MLDVDGIGISFGGLKAVQKFLGSAAAAGFIVRLDRPERRRQDDRRSICSPAFIARTTGRMELDSRSLVGLKPHPIAAAGIARTFQNIRLFPGLNVLDNVRLAGQLRRRHGLVATVFRSGRYRNEEAEICHKAFERERVHASILRKGFDAIPWQFDLTTAVIRKLEKHYGTDDIRAALDDHVAWVHLERPADVPQPADPALVRDELGAVWHRGARDYAVGDWGELADHPLKEPTLSGYRFPDGNRPWPVGPRARGATGAPRPVPGRGPARPLRTRLGPVRVPGVPRVRRGRAGLHPGAYRGPGPG